jgi:hypothetical protein
MREQTSAETRGFSELTKTKALHHHLWLPVTRKFIITGI